MAYSEEVINQTAFNFLSEGMEGVDQIMGLLKTLTQMSYENMPKIHDAIQNVSDTSKLDTADLREIIYEIGTKCNDLFSMCYFKGEEVACCDYFKPLISEQGFCYAFNPRYYSTGQEELVKKKLIKNLSNIFYRQSETWNIQWAFRDR